MSVISNSRPNLSISQGNLSNFGPASSLSLEKKAWFMCKILCRELNGFTFAQVRDRLVRCKGVKTRVKLNHKGWRVGSKLDLNPKVQAEFIPIECIERILQDVQYVNVLFVVLAFDSNETEVDLKYEIWAYKLKTQSSAFRFQDIFSRLTGIQPMMPRSVSRSELSVNNNFSLFPAKNYPMGPLAVDRWGGQQGPRSEASSYGYYGRTGGMPSATRNAPTSPYSVVAASSLQRMRDEPTSDSFESGGDNRTTTYREVAVSANFANSGNSDSKGKPILRSETSRVIPRQQNGNQRAIPNSSVSETWCQADDGVEPNNQDIWFQHEARAIVTPNHFNGPPNVNQTYTNAQESLLSSIDDSGFYNGSEIAVAHTRGGYRESIDVVDGSVSVRKVFNKKNPSTNGAIENGDFYRYPQESTSMLGRRARSTDYLGPGSANVNYGVDGRQASKFLQVSPSVVRGGSRSDIFNDNASVVSTGSSYLLHPKFKKGYVRRDQRTNNVMMGEQNLNYGAYSDNRGIIGQY